VSFSYTWLVLEDFKIIIRFNEKNIMNKYIIATILTISTLNLVHAQSTEKSSQNSPSAIASVNGTRITSEVFDTALANYIRQGLKDSTELREQVRNELIAKEALAQESIKLGFDKNISVQSQLSLIKQTFLADIAINKYLEKNPVNDEQLKTEYKRQLDVLSGTDQYLLSQIVLATESEANTALKLLQNGESFDKVAKEKSIDSTKINGGSLGWVIPNQVIPALSNVMVNLRKGSFSVSPIQTQSGWHIIKVDDKRPFKAPSFDESKAQLTQAVLLQKRNEYIQKIVKAAKVDAR